MRDSSRREFLKDSATCAGHLALAAAMAPALGRALWAQQPTGRVVRTEPFGRLEQVAEGVWALISTPLSGDRTTLSNGGLIAGRDGVLAIEGFMTPEGARWLANQARTLTGKWPTHVVLTHYHADHSNGVAGYLGEGTHPAVQVTPETVALIQKATPAQRTAVDDARLEALSHATAPGTEIDLGGRRARLVRRQGHTSSDVSVELDDPSVVFTGDLVWNAMFPNYVDATPSALSASVKALKRERTTTYIPGHGAVASAADVTRYQSMLDEVEHAARAAAARGQTPAEAAASFTLSPSLGEWLLFNKVFFERAFSAWARELHPGDG